MSARFYRFSTAVSRRTGPWFFRAASACVAAGFFLLFPRRAAASARFYRVLAPGRSGIHALGCALRQYLNFTRVFLDRFLLQEGEDIPYTSEGWHHLEAALERRSGGVILMSHAGNWEVAAHLLRKRRPDMPLLLYMGIRQKEEIERIQKESLTKSGVRIIAADPSGGSPVDLIEAVAFLKSGGLVSMTGDMLHRPDQRAVTVDFLGRAARLPETPHLLALISGAPIFVLFAFRDEDRGYAFSVTPPRYVRAETRARRGAAIQRSAQEYADLLAEAVRAHPLEWYHFGEFWEEARGAASSKQWFRGMVDDPEPR